MASLHQSYVKQKRTSFVWISLFYEFSNKLDIVCSSSLQRILTYVSWNLTEYQKLLYLTFVFNIFILIICFFGSVSGSALYLVQHLHNGKLSKMITLEHHGLVLEFNSTPYYEWWARYVISLSFSFLTDNKRIIKNTTTTDGCVN